eukprot:Hpha_TRINITY_DN4635_c0_g1::TRINITY_DN4635_c0_g1_i1::g.97214::m.97214
MAVVSMQQAWKDIEGFKGTQEKTAERLDRVADNVLSNLDDTIETLEELLSVRAQHAASCAETEAEIRQLSEDIKKLQKQTKGVVAEAVNDVEDFETMAKSVLKRGSHGRRFGMKSKRYESSWPSTDSPEMP